MNKEEVIRALGQPAEEKDYALTYSRETKDCARYDGDACVEYKKESNVIFLHNGYSESFNYGTEEDCHAVSGEYRFLSLKIPSDFTQEVSAIQKAKSDIQVRHSAQQAAERQSEQERNANQKRLTELRAECAPFVNGSPEKIRDKTMSLPPKECREVLSWMRDAYLDALYDLQKQSQ